LPIFSKHISKQSLDETDNDFSSLRLSESKYLHSSSICRGLSIVLREIVTLIASLMGRMKSQLIVSAMDFLRSSFSLSVHTLEKVSQMTFSDFFSVSIRTTAQTIEAEIQRFAFLNL